MTALTGIPVLAAPALDPGGARLELTLPEGLTIAEIVAMALPGASAADVKRARIALVTPRGAQIIHPDLWQRVRPKPGVRVVIRLIPGKEALRTILSIVVSIAAVALGAIFGGPLAGLLGISSKLVGGALVSLGVNLLGNLRQIPNFNPDILITKLRESRWFL